MINGEKFITSIVDDSILDTIGNTPLVSLTRISKCSELSVYGKLELANPGGSVKDRTALSIIKKGLIEGTINSETILVESSSGNMALGLAQVCRYYNIPLIIVVDPKANKQTIKILEVYGVTIETVKKPLKNGGFLGARLKRVNEILAQNPSAYWTNQYHNEANPSTHYRTMAEITDSKISQIDYVFVATSTCGTLMGCADYIKKNDLKTKLIAVDAEGSVIFNQTPKKRLIPGHGAGLTSHFLKKEVVDRVVHINDLECVEGCQLLLKKEGILAGGSSGAVVSAFLKIAKDLPNNSNVVLILCDRGERYMETIYNPNWVKKHFDKKIH